MLVAKNDVQGIKTEVEVTMVSGSVLYGEMFIRDECQMLDILNGEQQFLPFEGMDGAVSVINKSTIAKITQYSNVNADDGKLIAFG